MQPSTAPRRTGTLRDRLGLATPSRQPESDPRVEAPQLESPFMRRAREGRLPGKVLAQ